MFLIGESAMFLMSSVKDFAKDARMAADQVIEKFASLLFVLLVQVAEGFPPVGFKFF